jgi:hypothetical protein
MTFYEAALRVLEGAGRPLHIQEITEQSIAQNLLSHVGKAPDKTMLSRLAAMARRTRDRRVIVTGLDTFALAEWAIPEDPEALSRTGVHQPNPEEALPPLRQPERHPEARVDNVRAAGRPERRRRHDEEEARGRRRRLPPIPELVFDILSGAEQSLKPEQIAQLARERDMASTDLGAEQILIALLEDNQRRIDAGRQPLFILSRQTGDLSLQGGDLGRETQPSEVQAAFAEVLGLPMESGRPVVARAAVAPSPEAVDAGQASIRTAVKESRRTIARELRRRLAEMDIETLHKAFVKVLQVLGFRELRVAKRSREGLLLTARKREGSLDLRFAVRLLKGTGPVDRRAVQELRRDLTHYSAHAGLIASAGELRGDGRAEAQSHGSLTQIWCAEALGEKFIQARAGVAPVPLEVFEVDDGFFAAVRLEAEEARRRRDERLRERQVRDDRRPEPPESPGSMAPRVVSGSPTEIAVTHGAEVTDPAQVESGGSSADELEQDDLSLAEEENEESAAASAPAELPPAGPAIERKRRRKRRRGRRGRRPAEAPVAAAPSAVSTEGPVSEADSASEPAPPVPPPENDAH